MSLMNQLADTPVVGKDYSRLIQAVWDNPYTDDEFFVFVADAALGTDNLDFIVSVWRRAAKEARKALQTVTAANLELGLARIYSDYVGDQGKAIKRWEKILNMYSSSKEETEIGLVKIQASSNLTQQLLCNAVDAGFGTPEAEAMVTKLETLAKRTVTDMQSHAWILDGARANSVGAYYRLSGREADARVQFKPSITRSLQVLSDDDPENDEDGLIELLHVLVAAGDTSNVIAVAYMLAAFSDNSKEETMGQGYSCDGPCRMGMRSPENFAFCPICFNTAFCQECTKLVATNAVPFKTCSSKHVEHFIHIPPKPREIEKGKVLVDGEVVEFEAWKDQLRRKWDI
jgi:hypothetical protein